MYSSYIKLKAPQLQIIKSFLFDVSFCFIMSEWTAQQVKKK